MTETGMTEFGGVTVEVTYADEKRQTLLSVQVPRGSTVEETIHLSGILARHPEIDLASNEVGIFSGKVRLDQAVAEGDRIEVYRPLRIDPRQARRHRADLKRGKKEG